MNNIHTRERYKYVRGVGTNQRAGEHAMGTFHNTSYIYCKYCTSERKWAIVKQKKREK
jgi:hypothetical protein